MAVFPPKLLITIHLNLWLRQVYAYFTSQMHQCYTDIITATLERKRAQLKARHKTGCKIWPRQFLRYLHRPTMRSGTYRVSDVWGPMPGTPNRSALSGEDAWPALWMPSLAFIWDAAAAAACAAWRALHKKGCSYQVLKLWNSEKKSLIFTHRKLAHPHPHTHDESIPTSYLLLSPKETKAPTFYQVTHPQSWEHLWVEIG